MLLGKDRAAHWPAIARAEEKAGLPRVSLQYGGRYWPAVKQFYDDRYRLLEEQSFGRGDDREDENWSGPTLTEKKAARAEAKMAREAAATAKKAANEPSKS